MHSKPLRIRHPLVRLVRCRIVANVQFSAEIPHPKRVNRQRFGLVRANLGHPHRLGLLLTKFISKWRTCDEVKSSHSAPAANFAMMRLPD